ncbi:hypothetical protein B9Z55_010659 [Caenorhabditis nigoni]|uniref:Uncharacterized protein n=2 Tax=Caenorhabditis nigoni TaxID=1611254 RepID=A0A2G5UGU0_9PELO|nr:hypothetical protein B9Z55_010659 [Caenorhabditis nigoni]
MGSALSRFFGSMFSLRDTPTETRPMILWFDVHLMASFSCLILLDPSVQVRVYFLFYLALLTLPATFIVAFGNAHWMKAAFFCQLIRSLFIAFHNITYPILAASWTAVENRQAFHEASNEEIIFSSAGYGFLIFLLSTAASIFEPAKLYHICHLQRMLAEAPELADSDVEMDDVNDDTISETTDISSFVDLGLAGKMNVV